MFLANIIDKMSSFREKTCCGITLRTLCMVIGYMHLLSSIVDIICHGLTVAIVTNGFQCDITAESIRAISTPPSLEPFLLLLNLGTHGFYPFPRVFRSEYTAYVEYMALTGPPRCYPGMLHVCLLDVLNFIINLIWLRIVISYIGALHKRNPEPMRMFFSLSIVKLIMQIMYFGYQPSFSDMFEAKVYWFLKIVDIMITIFFLIIVKKYTRVLKAELSIAKIEKPPSYIECLMTAPIETKCDISGIYDKKETLNVDEEKKTDEKQRCDNPI